MARYGPWIQEPDYEDVTRLERPEQLAILTAASEPTRSDGRFSTTEVFDVPPPPYPMQPFIDLPALLSSALLSDYPGSPEEGLTSSGAVDLGYANGVELLNASAGSSAYAGSSIAPVVPGYYFSGRPEKWRPFAFYPEDYDEAAVGIEFEGDPDPVFGWGMPEWLSAEIDPTTALVGTIRERIDTNDGYYRNEPAVSRTFSSEIRAAPSWPGPATGVPLLEFFTDPYDYTTSGGSERRTLGTPVTITGSLVPDSGGVVWMRTPDYVPPTHPPAGEGGTWDWSYGWGFDSLRVRWTLRPPRYRWIYDTEPIRRVWPERDDTRRTWPPATSQQASGQTWGGYL